MVLDFRKSKDNRWYVVLPNWIGDEEDLEMIYGADLLCENLSNGSDKLSIEVFLNKPNQEGFIELTIKEHDDFGAIYATDILEEVYLCNVTHYVFDEHPDKLYIRPI